MKTILLLIFLIMDLGLSQCGQQVYLKWHVFRKCRLHRNYMLLFFLSKNETKPKINLHFWKYCRIIGPKATILFSFIEIFFLIYPCQLMYLWAFVLEPCSCGRLIYPLFCIYTWSRILWKCERYHWRNKSLFRLNLLYWYLECLTTSLGLLSWKKNAGIG